MFVIIGILIVIGAIVGGYLMEHGNLRVLVQPAELLIIGGAAIGTVLIANPLHILKKIAAGLVGVFGGSKFPRQRYLDSLKMMYELLNKARKEGLVALESDIETPDKSPVLSKYPAFIKDHHTRDFVCDTMRMAVSGGIEPFDMDQLLELDMDVQHHDATQPVTALSTMADALPGLGIVAAVLGVVITMGALGGPPEEIGHKVAAALVGTFLGILLCYGFMGPIATNLAKAAEDEHAYHYVLRVLMVAFTLTKDNMPQLKEQLQKSIHQVANFDKLKSQIEMTVTAEGLRIELLEAANGTFFDSGSPHPTSAAMELLATLAEELGRLPNKVTLEGHTDAKPYSGTGSYSNWELSSDRANAARRLMQQHGLRGDQVSQVRGYADQKLRNNKDPLEPANRRITLIVQYIAPPEPDEETKPSESPSEKPKAEHE